MLKDILDKHLEDKIPVVAVVAVVGTTEESSIDPLSEILQLRKSYSKKVNELYYWNGTGYNQLLFLLFSNALNFYQLDVNLAKASKSILKYLH